MSEELCEEYLYACQRAELLGEPAPSKEEWLANNKKNIDDEVDDNDNSDDVAQNLDQGDESMRRIGGGLDELNSILNVTQKKINRFKTVCGSLGSLLKVRIGSRDTTPNHEPKSTGDIKESDLEPNETLIVSSNFGNTATNDNDNDNDNVQSESILNNKKDGGDDGSGKSSTNPKKHEINEKIESHIDKLDSLINKAENAHYSMKYQSKQMKKIIKK